VLKKFLQSIPLNKDIVIHPSGSPYLESKVLNRVKASLQYPILRIRQKGSKEGLKIKDFRRITIKLPNDKPQLITGLVDSAKSLRELLTYRDQQKLENRWILIVSSDEVLDILRRDRKWKKMQIKPFSRFDRRKSAIVKELFQFRGRKVANGVTRFMLSKFLGDLESIEPEVGNLCDGISRSLITLQDLNLIYSDDDDIDKMFSAFIALPQSKLEAIDLWIKRSSISSKWNVGFRILQYIDQAILLRVFDSGASKIIEELYGFPISKGKAERLKKKVTGASLEALQDLRGKIIDACMSKT